MLACNFCYYHALVLYSIIQYNIVQYSTVHYKILKKLINKLSYGLEMKITVYLEYWGKAITYY